jgi:hypothetical protein
MLNLRGKCLILQSSWSGDPVWLVLQRRADTTPSNSEIMRQIILKTTIKPNRNVSVQKGSSFQGRTLRVSGK